MDEEGTRVLVSEANPRFTITKVKCCNIITVDNCSNNESKQDWIHEEMEDSGVASDASDNCYENSDKSDGKESITGNSDCTSSSENNANETDTENDISQSFAEEEVNNLGKSNESLKIIENAIIIIPEPNTMAPPATSAAEDAVEGISNMTLNSLDESKENSNDDKKKSRPFKRHLGIILAVLCSFCYSFSCFIASLLITTRNYGASYCTFWRFLGVTIPAVPILLYNINVKETSLFKSIWPLNTYSTCKTMAILILRVLLGISSIILHYLSLKYIDIGDAATIVFSNPVVVNLAARVFLKEPLGYVPLAASMFTILGVVAISKPTYLWDGMSWELERMYGVGLATLSMGSNALVFISLRYLRHVHFSVLGMTFGFIGLMWGIAETQLTQEWKWPEPGFELWDFTLLFTLAFTSFLAQVLLTLSLKYEEAGLISGIRTFDVLFSFAWQCVIHHYPDALSIIGATTVVSCVGVILFRKYLINKPVDSKLVKAFGFLKK